MVAVVAVVLPLAEIQTDFNEEITWAVSRGGFSGGPLNWASGSEEGGGERDGD